MEQKYDLIQCNGVTFVDPNAGVVKTTGGTSVMKVHASMLRGGNDPFHPELQYLALLQELIDLSDNDPREDRTGTGTYSVFGRSMRFDLGHGFPLLTTKKIHTKAMFAELAWMLRGDTNINTLDAKIWDEWADDDGNLGPIYGRQWRAWEGIEGHIDQLGLIIQEIKDNPSSRRLVVSAWNVADLPRMKLSPCHCLFQFYVDNGRLSCQLYQRSADIFLGVPFNIASYAAMTHLIAAECGLEVGEFIHTFGDLHLYSNHVEQAKEQLTRTPRALPTISIDPNTDLFDLQPTDITVHDYNPHDHIAAEVSV